MKSYVILLVLSLTTLFSVANVHAWTFCANEGGQCNFSGIKKVRYGADGRYSYRTFINGTNCSNSVFGDPAYGVVKHCHFVDADINLSHKGNWRFCANENSHCNFGGMKVVRYGADGRYTFGYFMNGVSCSNSIFGDPAYGVKKHCYVADLAMDLSTLRNWRFCANENGYCNINGLQAVRYGANGRYVYGLFSSGVSCSNSVFGDPAYGIVKHCHVSDL